MLTPTDPDVMADLEQLAKSIVRAECRQIGIDTTPYGRSPDGAVTCCVADSTQNATGGESGGASLNRPGAALLKGGFEQTPNCDGRGPFHEHGTS